MKKLRSIIDYLRFGSANIYGHEVHDYLVRKHISKKNSLKIKGINVPRRTNDFDLVLCELTESRHRNVLDRNSIYYREGCVLIKDNIPLGHVKYFRENSFLSWQNINNNGNVNVYLGGLYGLNDLFLEEILDRKTNNKREWDFFKINELELYAGRYIVENIREKCSTRELIRHEKNLVQNLLKSN